MTITRAVNGFPGRVIQVAKDARRALHHVLLELVQVLPALLLALVDALATKTPGQLADAVGADAHAQLVTTFKKSTFYGPDFITTTYGYSMDHYSANQEKFLEVQEAWYATIPIMPKWALGPFVYSLGYILLLVGITTFLGIKTRLSLAVMALTYVALAYGSGLMVAAGASPKDLMNLLLLSLFVHLFMTVYALTLSKHEKLALVK